MAVNRSSSSTPVTAERAAGGGFVRTLTQFYHVLFPSFNHHKQKSRARRAREQAEEKAKVDWLAKQYPGHRVHSTSDPNAIPESALVVFTEDRRVNGSHAMRAIAHPLAKVPASHPVYVHGRGCGCANFDFACPVEELPAVSVAAGLEFFHGSECHSPAGAMMHRKHGLDKCIETGLWYMQQDHTPIGNNYTIADFNGSPQQHAVLNRHLLDYFKGVARSRETTPYAVDTSQLYLLDQIGMERPQPDAPTVPHGLHKSIEEFQLRLMRQWLAPNEYGLISVKASKTHLLPTPGSVQNPVYEAKDVSRYPGAGLTTSHLRDFPVHFLHDVSSEVGPHELVERLVADNPTGHLFVTGMNPIEVVDRVKSFEPASHVIDYDLESFNFVFTGSESSAYYTPITTTVSWLRTAAVVGSNGLVYQVVLLDYKLGHCVWHIFQSDVAIQDSRTFSTGSYVQVPAVLTGTWSDEWLPSKMLTAILSFAPRTPDTSFRNYAAKVAQLMTNTLPKMTAREHWIATHLVHQLPGNDTWAWRAKQALWKALAFVTFQWNLLKSAPDLYDFVDERKRYRVLHPTMGGGWTPACKSAWTRASIPNNPSWLQRLSAFTSAAFTFILPKLLIGEIVSHLVMHVPVVEVARHLLHWADVSPLRLGLTVAIVAITSVLPGHVVKVFTRLAGHFWRQLWLPGWISTSVERLITEVCGGPGARWAMFLPGRGWFYQAYLWALGLVSIFPNLIAHWVVPWLALHSPFGLLLVGWWLMIMLENVVANCKAAPLDCPIDFPNRNWSYGCDDWVRDFMRSDFDAMVYPFHVVVWHCGSNWVRWACWLAKRQLNAIAQWLPVSRGVLLSQPAFVNLPALPQVQPRVVATRNVDRPLPAVTLQTRLQAAPGAGQIAVDPTGMRFHEWVQEVQRAYATATTRYPALTPGQSCFWDAVSSFGGTAHMWYSWFMDYTSTVPDPNNNVVGNVVQADMLNFAAASQFGLRLTGMLEIAHDAQGGWPVITLRLTRSPIMGQLHVELAGPTADTAAIGALARIIRTVRDIWPAWDRAFQRELNLAAVDSIPVASDWMLAVLGVHQPIASRDEIVAAVLGSYACTRIPPVNQEGFTFDLNVAYDDPYPTFFSYRAPVANQRIASTPARSMWKKFSNVARGLRLVVPETFVEPACAVLKPAGSDLDLKVTKIGATLAQNNDNAVRNNEAPRPARWTVLRNELATVLHKYKALQLPAVPLAEEVIQYTADVDRAARLVADLKAHPHVLGSRGSPVVLQALDSILDLHKLSGAKITVPVRAYLGVAGSGKTTATVAYLHTLEPAIRQQVRVASHTESLRAQTKLQLDFPELKGFNFPTIPALITEPSVGPIVLDEAGKYWGGMLDLIILANPLVSEVVVNGDPAQGMARFPVSNTQSEYDLSPLAALAPQVTRYATVSHRMFRTLADVLGVHTTNSVVGHVTHTIAAKIGLPVCTASPRYMGVLAGAGRRAYTYEGVQGEDFREDVEIDATGLESAILDRTAYVALTRSRTGVFLHMEPLNPLANAKTQPTGSDLLNAILFGMRERNQSFADSSYWLSRAAFARHLELCMPMLPWFAPIGATIPTADFQLVANPATSHMPTDGAVEDGNGVDLAPSAAPPIDEFVRETHWHAKEHREVAGRGGATNQFKETAFVNPHVHSRADTATYFLSVAKRLTSRTQQANLRRMLACPRRDMCDEFDRLVPVAPKWTPAKHAEYTDRSVNEYTSTRTAEAVYGKLRAHDPDRTGCDIKITLKNQVIKKDEKRHKKEAIPGQLVHEYDIRQTLEDAPYALFLEDELIDAFPSNFLFYRRMSPQGFIDKYQSRWRVNNGVYSSDVTRWDVGCDAGMLNFDVHVMRRCGLPNDYIEAYMERRLSSRSQHGGMGTMQNSGDRYTWSLNSIRRAVVTSLVNAVRPEDTVAINGDDSAIDRFALSERFDDSPWEFKDQNGMRGEFSGFELGGPKPEYSAGGILYRTMILESRDPSAMDKWVNYLGLLEFANPETPEAADVARSAQRHMQPHLFARYLPAALRPMFPNTQWFVSN